METSKKWKIFIVGHDSIYDETVSVDSGFNNTNYCYLNVGNKEKMGNSDGYEVINQRDLPCFVSLGAHWAESEGLYNLWRSGVHLKLDYIGFIHYDVQLKLKKKYSIGKKTNITERINRYIRKKENGHISFATFDTISENAQTIMYDFRFPNTLCGEGKKSYETILEDYNYYFGTNFSIDDFLMKKKINLCSCFLVDSTTFDKMMHFFDWIIQSKKMDAFDVDHKYRFQGGMAERYFGVFLMFEYDNMLDLNLNHMWNAGWK